LFVKQHKLMGQCPNSAASRRDLTPLPPSLQGKGECWHYAAFLFPSPRRREDRGEVSNATQIDARIEIRTLRRCRSALRSDALNAKACGRVCLGGVCPR